MKRLSGENTQDYLTRIKNSAIENQIRPIVELIASHLYPEQDKVKRSVTRKEEVDKTLQDWFRETVWNHGDTDYLDDTKSLNALVTGYSIVQRFLYDFRTMKPFVRGTQPLTMVKNGIIIKKLLDSCCTVPLPYIDENGVVENDKLGAILSIYDTDNFVGSMTLMSLLNKNYQKQTVIEYIDSDIWVKWVKNQNENAYQQVTVNAGTDYENRNPFRDISVLFTVYRNTGDPFSVEGDSEVGQLKSLNTELNELGTGDKDTITYHQDPLLVGSGGADLPDDFVKSKNSFVAFDRKDAKLQYITWDGNLEASAKRQETLRRVMSNVTGVSLISRGFLSEIGQIRSGPPLKALFTSERSIMSRKFKAFGKGERADMKADILFWEKSTSSDLKVDKSISFNIEYQHDFLGLDKLLNEEIKSLQLQAGSESREDIIAAEHPDWTEAEVATTVKEIDKALQSKTNAGKIKQTVKSTDKSQLTQDNNTQG